MDFCKDSSQGAHKAENKRTYFPVISIQQVCKKTSQTQHFYQIRCFRHQSWKHASVKIRYLPVQAGAKS